MTFSLQNLTFDSQGLIPAIIQEQSTRTVLMLGYMNEEALMRTITEHRVTFWSRSRQELWRKGDTSGHIQTVQSISYDCDADALLIQVEQTGVACHSGEMTCFHNHDLNNNGEDS